MGGYWEPHSSSIDFCESNYLHSHFIAEPHNVWSSLVGITGFGLLGLWQTMQSTTVTTTNGPWQEWRVRIAFGILAATGLGSVCLHWTLHWFFQSSDELPMIYLMLSLLYSCAQVDSTPATAKKYPWLAPAMVLAAVASTIVYFTFQHFYWFFLLTFITESTVASVWIFYLVFYKQWHPDSMTTSRRSIQRIYMTGNFFYLVCGSTSWVLDMLCCESLVQPYADHALTGWFRGTTPHVLWHFAAGLSGYCAVLCIVCCRCHALHIPVQVHFWMGLVPWIEPPSQEKKTS